MSRVSNKLGFARPFNPGLQPIGRREIPRTPGLYHAWKCPHLVDENATCTCDPQKRASGEPGWIFVPYDSITRG